MTPENQESQLSDQIVFVNKGLSPDARLANVVGWFAAGAIVLAQRDPGESVVGQISELPKAASGIWGYCGDSIAVKINGDFWPSGRVTPHV